MEQINLQLGKNYDMTYRSLCSSERSLIFCDFLNQHSQYEEVTDEKYLREFIDDSLKNYNSSFGVIPMNLVLFRDAIDHICRIARVISQPRGYIMLVGIGIISATYNYCPGICFNNIIKHYNFSDRWIWTILACKGCELAVRLQNVYN